MKIFIYLVITLLTGFTLLAQEVSISGKIVESNTDNSMPFATVSLTDVSTGTLISGAITNEEGRFEISGSFHGNYTLKVSFIGYENYSEKLLIGELNKNFDLGKIQLKPVASNLDEVTIKAQKSVVSSGMEKKTFSMDDNIAQSGGSVLDAMKLMPGVTVDNEGKVILRGSDKVVVTIDGKQSSLTGFGNQKGLDNIPVANIEKIEIINNPSAKYDARGMAGIINIVYKKEQDKGFNATLGFDYGIGALTKPRPDLPTDLGSYSANPKYIPNLDLNYRNKKINLFLQSEVMFLNKLANNEFTDRYYDDGSITHSQVPENRTQQHYIVKGGVDVFLNEQNTITFSGIYDWEKHIDTAQVPYINGITNERYRFITWNEEEITGYMNFAINYKHKFLQPGHELEASLQYTKGWEDETYHINDSSEIRHGRDITNILATENTTSMQLDYTKPLRGGRLEVGAKLQIRRLPVEYSVDSSNNSIIYPDMGAWSDWGENIYAGYFNYVYEQNKYDIEAGLRAEQTNVFYDMDPQNKYYDQNDKYNYFELFPSVRLSYKPDKNNRISAFYNRRIDRPGEPELRIFAKSDDHELLKVGNPYLRPQFTQSFELAYKFKWQTGSVYLAGFYRIIDNPYTRIYTADTTNADFDVIIKTFANTGNGTNMGVEFIFGQQLLPFWKLTANVNYYRNEINAYTGTLLFPYEHTFTIQNRVDNPWDMKLSNLFTLPHEFELQLTWVYFSAINIAQGKQLSRSSIDFGLKKKVLKGKGEINFSASDIFNKFGIRQEIDGESFHAKYENYYETQVFRIGFKYKL